MKLCLLFHCLCESYDDIPAYGQDLFVSLPDLRSMIEELSARGYRFGSLEDPGQDTVSITFDDGYYNNVLFGDLAHSYSIPYLIFVPAYYNQTGDPFPWFSNNGRRYKDIHLFDFYEHFDQEHQEQDGEEPDQLVRPMTFPELSSVVESGLAEIGCHGYYHQALSPEFEHYLPQERDLALSCLEENLGIKPRYFSLSNGAYTKGVIRELLKTFDRVLTTDARPYRSGDDIIHRITLINPNMAGPLVQQVDWHVTPIKRMRRAVRTFARTHW